MNSATEVSTDSEFDRDPVNHDPPKIFIDDTHLRRSRVHVKSTNVINNKKTTPVREKDVHLNFKPLVEVDPTIVKREPLKNPLPGNYLLSKTASTEGIASKKSLELKKRYLLGGESGLTNPVLKSDSASALDTKMKSFHSTISECQKLLNPAPEISPSMQTFLQRIDRNNELNRSQHSITLNKSNKDLFNNNQNQEEKENRSIDSNKKEEYSETVNTALIEGKIRKLTPEVPEIIEIVDLTTPEKKEPIVDLDKVEIPKSTIDENKQFIENMEKSSSPQAANMKIKSKLDSMFIDLTLDSPPKDRPKEQNNNSNAVVPDIISNINTESIERPRSPAHETTIAVPQMWTKPLKDIDTDSLSNSSTSSLEDIPHYILDSTTSPETQHEAASFQNLPKLEVRDTSGELMQIDSLMIIDGQYVGDPEDLPLFNKDKLPEKVESPVDAPKPALKFDTKNENKLESLKNLPLIVPPGTEEVPVIAPKSLSLKLTEKKSPVQTPDDPDKTPLAGAPLNNSDSDNEITGQGLTETELSDWTVDDALSENFMDIEFALNSGKGTIKKNRRRKKKSDESSKSSMNKKTNKMPQVEEGECGILKNLAIEEIDFMDTGSEDSCVETLSATNKAMIQNRGYVKFVDHKNMQKIYEPQKPKEKSPPIVEAINMEIVNVDYIEQGACILNNDLKTPINEDPLDSLNTNDDIDEDSLIINDEKNQNESIQTFTTTTDTTEELTIVTSPESVPQNIVGFSANTTAPSSTVITSESTPSLEKDFEPIKFERTSDRASSTSRMSREQIEEMGGYEEYVKSLQMKIAQISSGRESLEKKSRRKLSKSDLLCDENKSGSNEAIKSIFTPIKQIDPAPTLSMKLDELTKERTKQKDIIHDLVMNKLQAKKQQNAEKRQNRTRSRNLFMGSGPLSPSHTPDSLSSIEPSKTSLTYRESVNNLKKYDENGTNDDSTSEPQTPKVLKTQSFCYYAKQIPLNDEDFKTPAPPPRNRLNSDVSLTAEKMREDARARARLKSNEDLGLSPEEKILLLRKRYNLTSHDAAQTLFTNGRNQSDDMKHREKKLSSSKSFSDISRMHRHSREFSDCLDGIKNRANEFASDSNLAESPAHHHNHQVEQKSPTKSTKSQRRDSERRKSLIQTVSNFFHKKKDQSASNKDLSSMSPTSISKDRLSENSSNSVFSRFRLSPKSKESSKDKAKVC